MLNGAGVSSSLIQLVSFWPVADMVARICRTRLDAESAPRSVARWVAGTGPAMTVVVWMRYRTTPQGRLLLLLQFDPGAV